MHETITQRVPPRHRPIRLLVHPRCAIVQLGCEYCHIVAEKYLLCQITMSLKCSAVRLHRETFCTMPDLKSRDCSRALHMHHVSSRSTACSIPYTFRSRTQACQVLVFALPFPAADTSTTTPKGRRRDAASAWSSSRGMPINVTPCKSDSGCLHGCTHPTLMNPNWSFEPSSSTSYNALGPCS